MSIPMDAYAEAMRRLRQIGDALNAADLVRASELLAEHDCQVRAAFECAPPLFAVSEAEALDLAQRDLLKQLEAVQTKVEEESRMARRGGAAARAYLGDAGA